jgi:anaphase-promoting complex subunit 1
VFHRPEEPTNTHAGFLYGLGLTGHLKNLATYHSFEYLNAKHDLTSVGLLLGLSTAYRGTADERVTKLLGIHIPAMLPPQSTDLNLSSLLQVAAIASLGLLYMGNVNRRMVEVALTEMGRRQLLVSDANCVYRESYSLTAGFTLGFIMLGRGDDSTGLSDLSILDKLRQFITGGRGNAIKASLSSTIAPNAVHDLQYHRFREGDEIHTGITTPSATIALGLMYLKTNNRNAAALLDVPQTATALVETSRPDCLILQILCRSMILWRDIEGSQQWVESLVPDCVRETWNYLANRNQRNLYRSGAQCDPTHDATLQQVYLSITAGGCLSLALRFAGSADTQILKILLGYFDLYLQQSPSRMSAVPQKSY